MVMCFAPDCKHYSEKHGCRFFVFPKEEKEKKIWLKLVRREDREPSKYSLVCSCHFVNADRRNRSTIYERNQDKIFKVSPEKKKQRTKSSLKKCSAGSSTQSNIRSKPSASLQSRPSTSSSIEYNEPRPSTSSSIEYNELRPSTSSSIEYNEPRPSTSSSIEYKELRPSTSSSIEYNEPRPSTSSSIENDEPRPSTSSSTEFNEPRPSTSNSNDDTRPQTSLSDTSQLAQNMRILKLEEENKKRFTAMTEAENYFLNEQVNQLTANLNNISVCFSWDHIKNNDKRILMYTGLPNKEIFVSVFNLMQNFELKYYYGWSVIGLSKINQFLMTLMKLRLNLHHEDLACRFNISRTTVSNVILTWIHALHEVIFEQLMDEIPSRQKNKLCAPTAFNSFTNCRIIIDCTEISAVSPKNMDTQQLTYSSYKHRNTLKGLVGVAPNGVCTFISKLYPGSISDKKNFAHCGLRDKLVPGDLVLADKGFLIVDLLPDGVTLNIPPFLTTPQFTPEQVYETYRIARARIHVERAIQRIKCFDILNKIPSTLIPQSSYIFQVCGALTNFQFPLIKEVEDLFCRNEF